ASPIRKPLTVGSSGGTARQNRYRLLLTPLAAYDRRRPFRDPHHSIDVWRTGAVQTAKVDPVNRPESAKDEHANPL
ncbi:MAG TPA: hypothetical protein VGX03_04470, partial [Candidatus Binatia bacterium]|nr:hypothetical protein [Candidatus Binatia bacterium]